MTDRITMFRVLLERSSNFDLMLHEDTLDEARAVLRDARAAGWSVPAWADVPLFGGIPTYAVVHMPRVCVFLPSIPGEIVDGKVAFDIDEGVAP